MIPSFRFEPQEELLFRGPFSDGVCERLRVENTGECAIGFKVKTTTPKKFNVKPNVGCLEGHSSKDVLISLGPHQHDPADRTRHKFLVQILPLPSAAPESDATVENMIKECERNTPSKLYEKKLRVSIVPSDQERHAPAGRNGLTQTGLVLAGEKQRLLDPHSTSNSNCNHEDTRVLEADISHLRHENLQLKEENAHQRKQISRLQHHHSSQSQSTTSGTAGSIEDSQSHGQTCEKASSTPSGLLSCVTSLLLRSLFYLLILLVGVALGHHLSSRGAKGTYT